MFAISRPTRSRSSLACISWSVVSVPGVCAAAAGGAIAAVAGVNTAAGGVTGAAGAGDGAGAGAASFALGGFPAKSFETRSNNSLACCSLSEVRVGGVCATGAGDFVLGAAWASCTVALVEMLASGWPPRGSIGGGRGVAGRACSAVAGTPPGGILLLAGAAFGRRSSSGPELPPSNITTLARRRLRICFSRCSSRVAGETELSPRKSARAFDSSVDERGACVC